MKEGDQLPQFELKDQNGKTRTSSELIGDKPLVLFFYPKDESYGCTKEVCSFRDAYEDFKDAGAQVVGVSSDSVKKHQKFAEKQRLPFTLLSDPDRALRKKMNVKGDLFGLIPGRATYVIDRKGKIRHIFNSQMKYDQHADIALEEIRKIKD